MGKHVFYTNMHPLLHVSQFVEDMRFGYLAEQHQSLHCFEHTNYENRIQRGGGWVGRGSGPPLGKSKVNWVYIGNKELDPPTQEKVGPPGKSLTPSGTLENNSCL